MNGTTHHIGIAGAVSMGVVLIASKALLALPRELSAAAATAAWITILTAGCVAALIVVGVSGVLRLHPQVSLTNATEQCLGPYLGTVVNMAYLLFFTGVVALRLRQFSEILVSIFLPTTPIQIVMGAILIVSTYMAFQGIEVICRVARLSILGMGLFLAFLLVGGVVMVFSSHAFSPLWGNGAVPVLRAGVEKAGHFGELLIFGVIATSFRRPGDLVRSAWWTLVLATGIVLAVTMVYQMVFPFPTAERIAFPLLTVSRVIIVGRFLQRLESLFLVIWIVAAVIKLGSGVFASAQILTHMVKVPDHRHFTLILSVILFFVALLPTNLAMTERVDVHVLTAAGLFIAVGLPLLTWGIGAVRKGIGNAKD